jgi:hypothetical protein
MLEYKKDILGQKISTFEQEQSRAADVAEFCFKRLSSKGRTPRMSCNGCKPTKQHKLPIVAIAAIEYVP